MAAEKGRRLTQADRLARREVLRADIAKREREVASLRAEEARLLEECEHEYADGRHAVVGGSVKVCSICGRVLPKREDKLWG
jgi:hypothetical protein